MGDPLAADHELVFDVGPEGVGQAAVPAGQPDAAFNRRLEVAFLLGRDGALRVDLNDEVQRFKFREVLISVEGVRDLDLEALGFEPGGENVHARLRLVALPAAPDK